MNNKFKVIFLMGLIVLGKIDLVIVLCESLLVEVVSVDFVLIYKGMDIGIVKLSFEELVKVLYCLIDILDLVESYFVMNFWVDVLKEMVEIIVSGWILLFVGGMMFYYKVLIEGFLLLFFVNSEVWVKIE